MNALAMDVEFPEPSFNTLFGTLTDARRLDGTRVDIDDQGEPLIQDLRSVPGGVELDAVLSLDDEGANAIDDVVATASLSVHGEFEPRPVPSRVDGSRLLLTFPDIDGTATVDLRIAYRASCYRLTSTATGTVRIGSVATVSGCPAADESAMNAYLREEFEDLTVLVDETPVPWDIQEGEWPWLGGNFASDSGTLFGMWDRGATPIHGAAGERRMFRLSGADARLTGMMTRFYTRSDAVHEFDREIEPVVTRSPKVQADGTVLLRLPDEPGRFVAFTSFGWSTPCLIATSVANFEVDVE